MESNILSDILKASFLESPEPTNVYRLGFFNDASHDLVELFENEDYKPHYHEQAEGWLHFVLGTGIIIIDGQEKPYKPGSSFFIPKASRHGFQPTTRTLILSIQTPPVKDLNGDEDLKYDEAVR